MRYKILSKLVSNDKKLTSKLKFKKGIMIRLAERINKQNINHLDNGDLDKISRNYSNNCSILTESELDLTNYKPSHKKIIKGFLER